MFEARGLGLGIWEGKTTESAKDEKRKKNSPEAGLPAY